MTQHAKPITVKDLADSFNTQLMYLSKLYDEVIHVFDTNKEPSLKNATREKRRQGRDPIQYKVTDDTRISHIPLSMFLSHDKTKDDLTVYLAEKVLEYNTDTPKNIITSAAVQTKSNNDRQFVTKNKRRQTL